MYNEILLEHGFDATEPNLAGNLLRNGPFSESSAKTWLFLFVLTVDYFKKSAKQESKTQSEKVVALKRQITERDRKICELEERIGILEQAGRCKESGEIFAGVTGAPDEQEAGVTALDSKRQT